MYYNRARVARPPNEAMTNVRLKRSVWADDVDSVFDIVSVHSPRVELSDDAVRLFRNDIAVEKSWCSWNWFLSPSSSYTKFTPFDIKNGIMNHKTHCTIYKTNISVNTHENFGQARNESSPTHTTCVNTAQWFGMLRWNTMHSMNTFDDTWNTAGICI